MEAYEVAESGFFITFLMEYQEYYGSKSSLFLYDLCTSEEEEIKVTQKKIKKIKKRITEFEDISDELSDLGLGYLRYLRIGTECQIVEKEEDTWSWEVKFIMNFIKNMPDIMPYTFYTKFLEERRERKEFDEYYWVINSLIENETRNIPDLIAGENNLLAQIENDIANNKNGAEFCIDFDFYKYYKDKNETIGLLFNYSELYFLLDELINYEGMLKEYQRPNINNSDDNTPAIVIQSASILGLVLKNEISPKEMSKPFTLKELPVWNMEDLGIEIISSGNETEETVKEINLFPRIFKDSKAYKIFGDLQNTIAKRPKNHLADYSFIIRHMQKDGYIYEDLREQELIHFLSENYEVELTRIRLLGYNDTDHKLELYSSAIISNTDK